MIERAIPIMIGLPLIATGFGLTAAFGIFAFIGMPLLIVGLGCLSVGVNPPASAAPIRLGARRAPRLARWRDPVRRR